MFEKYINSSQVLLLSHCAIRTHSHDICLRFYGTLKDLILKTRVFWMLRDADVSPEHSNLISTTKNSKNKIQAGHVEHAADLRNVCTYSVEKP
jgi:RNA-splicing ligase RtcB